VERRRGGTGTPSRLRASCTAPAVNPVRRAYAATVSPLARARRAAFTSMRGLGSEIRTPHRVYGAVEERQDPRLARLYAWSACLSLSALARNKSAKRAHRRARALDNVDNGCGARVPRAVRSEDRAVGRGPSARSPAWPGGFVQIACDFPVLGSAVECTWISNLTSEEGGSELSGE
jgi:hypothetical protein